MPVPAKKFEDFFHENILGCTKTPNFYMA